MKKRSGLLAIFLAVASIVIIFFGRSFFSGQEDQMLEESLYAQNGSGNETGSGDENTEAPADSDEQLSEYEANRDSLSFVETLHYHVLSNDGATLTYYGDINTDEAWFSEMNNFIHSQTNDGVSIEDQTYSGTDTYDLYIDQTPQNVVETNPDMVVYGMPALSDKERDIAVSDVEEYLSSIIQTLRDGMPDAEIVLLEPHPFPSEIDNYNSRSLDYVRYLDSMNEVAAENGLPVLHMHERFLTASEENGTELSSLFQEDGLSLDEEGLNLYVELLRAALTDPLNEEQLEE